MINNTTINDDRFINFSNAVLSSVDSTTVMSFENIETFDSFPKNISLVDLMDIDSAGDCVVTARDFVNSIEQEYDLQCTLCAYYPPDGFIDWHTNQNVNYYNAICTFSLSGNSGFEYKNTENNVVSISDSVGWAVKKTFWGSSPVTWHRAYSNDQRITCTFSSSDESKVQAFIESITV